MCRLQHRMVIAEETDPLEFCENFLFFFLDRHGRASTAICSAVSVVFCGVYSCRIPAALRGAIIGLLRPGMPRESVVAGLARGGCAKVPSFMCRATGIAYWRRTTTIIFVRACYGCEISRRLGAGKEGG